MEVPLNFHITNHFAFHQPTFQLINRSSFQPINYIRLYK